mgnify:CR=1 FL=1
MVRISKQAERRQRSPRRPKLAGKKTGSKQDNLENGFKALENAIESNRAYIGKISK